MMTGRPMLSSSASQPGRSLAMQLARVRIKFEQIGAGNFQPGVGVDFPIRSVIVLEQRRMAVMKGQETAWHSGLTGELCGRMREEDRLFTQANHSPLAGHLVKDTRPNPEENQADRAEGSKAWARA